MHDDKPKFGRFELWGACSRCGARVRYSTLARERLTGLLVCTKSSGRPVRPCLDPWPPVYDFQSTPDKSIEPPPEPLPARWGLDDIFSVAAGIKTAVNDAARLQALMIPPSTLRGTASFISYQTSLNQNQDRATLLYINPADYDGTFMPSNSVRTVEPPDGIMPWAKFPDDPPAHFPVPTPPDTTPDWVPANAKIHIDFLGGTPQGRAWNNGVVAIDTLLGSDPNTENGQNSSEYDPSLLTADGYICNPDTGTGLAFIGDARDKVLNAATIVYRTVNVTGNIYTASYFALLSADGNDAVEIDVDTPTIAYSWNGSASGQLADAPNSINQIAATITNTRLEAALNGLPAVALTLDETDRPSSNPLVAVYLQTVNGQDALQSITIYDPLPDINGLSELSMP